MKYQGSKIFILCLLYSNFLHAASNESPTTLPQKMHRTGLHLPNFFKKLKPLGKKGLKDSFLKEYHHYYPKKYIDPIFTLAYVQKITLEAREQYEKMQRQYCEETNEPPSEHFAFSDLKKELKNIRHEKELFLKEYSTYYHTFTLNPELPLPHIEEEVLIARKRYEILYKKYKKLYQKKPPKGADIETFLTDFDTLDKEKLLREYSQYCENPTLTLTHSYIGISTALKKAKEYHGDLCYEYEKQTGKAPYPKLTIESLERRIEEVRLKKQQR